MDQLARLIFEGLKSAPEIFIYIYIKEKRKRERERVKQKEMQHKDKEANFTLAIKSIHPPLRFPSKNFLTVPTP